MASKVVDLLYWRDVSTTGLVFTGLVVGLACLFQLSTITVLSNLGLGIMVCTLPVRLLYKGLELVRVNKEGAHPFQSYLEEDSSLTDENTVQIVEQVVLLIATAITEMKRLFLVDSIVESVKLMVLLYLLTYVGAQTNGLTLVIVGVICAFSLPLSYKLQQARLKRIARAIRSVLRKIKNKIKNIYHRVSNLFKQAPAPPPAPAPAPASKQKLKTK